MPPELSALLRSPTMWTESAAHVEVTEPFAVFPKGRVPSQPNASAATEHRLHHGPAFVTLPTLTAYRPRNVPGRTAVVIAPGGGYKWLTAKESKPVARYIALTFRVTTFVLKYRVPGGGDDGSLEWGEAPLQDAQRAVSLLRFHAHALRLDPERIGVLGFSAGANLAIHLSRRHKVKAYSTIDGVDDTSSRPSFTLGVYPFAIFNRSSADCAGHRCPFRGGLLRAFDTDVSPTFLAQELEDNGGVDASGYFAVMEREMQLHRKSNELHLFSSSGAHGAGICSLPPPVTPNLHKQLDRWRRQCHAKAYPFVDQGTSAVLHGSWRGIHSSEEKMCATWAACAGVFMNRVGMLPL